MIELGVKCVIAPGTGNNWGFGGALVWLTGVVGRRSLAQYLVFPLEGDPLLVYAMGGAHAELARIWSAVAHVRAAVRGQFASETVSWIRQLGLAGSRIGVLEASENPGVEWPLEAQMQVLFEELPDAQIELISGLFHELAYIKSQEEIEAIGRAGALAVAAMQAMVAQARPGMSEHQLTAVAMRVILAAEGRPAFIRIGSSPGADPALTTANPLPSRRKLKPQDLLLIEVSAMLQGVTAQVGTAVCLGQPELPVKQLWYEVTAPGYEQLETLLRPNPIRADGRWGMALSRTYLVGEDGPTCLTEYPMNLDVVDPDLNGWVE
jgi:Xaa-Pro aminopeptidase